jgi:hypothetical protein
LSFPDVTPEKHARLQESLAKTAELREPFDRALGSAKTGREVTPAAGEHGRQDRGTPGEPKVTLELEVLPGSLHALQPVPLRLRLSNLGTADARLVKRPNAKLALFAFSILGPGEPTWTSVALFPDTTGAGLAGDPFLFKPGEALILHAEPQLFLGYQPGPRTFKGGEYRIRALFTALVDAQKEPVAHEVRVTVQAPAESDLGLLNRLVGEGWLGFLGTRAPVSASAGVKTPAEIWTLLADLAPGREPDEAGALVAELAAGLPAPETWPKAERLLLLAYAAEKAGNAILAGHLRDKFRRLCPDDVHLGPQR